MRWLFRPGLLVVIAAALAVVAAALVFSTRADSRPEPRPVQAGEHEIAWLYAATTASNWERFVSAVRLAVERLQTDYPDLDAHIDANTFPRQTTAVPELAITLRNGSARLLFRWYKLTSSQKTHDWVKALTERQPPPLAIIGGNSSDLAIELARALKHVVGRQPDKSAPLLLLTTSTADNVQSADDLAETPLMQIYDRRSFRFCFSNQQMAHAVTDFIWSRDELRPDSDPVYTVSWEDDPYSTDLVNNGFYTALRTKAAVASAQDLAWLTGGLAHGSFPLTLNGLSYTRFRWMPSLPQRIDSSLGDFNRPNRFDALAAEYLVEDFVNHPWQRRPLLVLSAQTQPCRRFLHALVRTAPTQARRFVVATGDAIAFNTIYRDRNVAWPIQDLPLSLVLFCHRNPVDAGAGFRPARVPAIANDDVPATTGTEDLLLYLDIVEALVRSSYQGAEAALDAEWLRERLHRIRVREGRIAFDSNGPLLFDDDGNRSGRTGEHVVWLRPQLDGDRVKPQATITVWSHLPSPPDASRWRQASEPLEVFYGRGAGEGGGIHAGD